MKIIYCTHSTYNPGGMERVLLNKVTYLSQLPGWEVSVVTTDQNQRSPFYPFPEKVRMTDLGINYSEDNGKGAWKKITGYLRKRKEHKRKLTALLLKEKPDIVVSLYPSESSFIPDIKDGSRKVLELHYCKFFRLQYGRRGLFGWIDKLRTRQDEQIVRRFDKFVVLYNPQIQISAESETKRSIFREKDKTKRSKKESAQHSKSRNKSFVMTSVSAL